MGVATQAIAAITATTFKPVRIACFVIDEKQRLVLGFELTTKNDRLTA